MLGKIKGWRSSVHHQLQEYTQTHVHCVSDAIQSSHPLAPPAPQEEPQPREAQTHDRRAAPSLHRPVHRPQRPAGSTHSSTRAGTVCVGGLNWSGMGAQALHLSTSSFSVLPGGRLDSGADGEGLGEDASDPWGRRADVSIHVPAVDPWMDTPRTIHILPILPVNGTGWEVAGLAKDSV